MDNFYYDIAVIFAAYLLGTTPSAVWVCRVLINQDPRDKGSHNPGATNVMRIAGRKAALITFLCDFGKGWLALALAQSLALSHPMLVVTAIAVTLGHIMPFYALRRGGKGVATAMGVCVGFYWPLGVAMMLCWLLIFAISRTSSLASLLSCAVICVACTLFLQQYEEITAALGLLLFVSHRDNIRRLIAKQEHHF